MILLLSIAGLVESVRLSSLRDPNIWLHLRVGAWILENRTWPVAGLFSQAANLSWRDFSWLADAAMAIGYRVVGLSVVPAAWMVYRLALAAATFYVAGGSAENFWFPVALSVLAQYLLYSFGPIGAGMSALFFCVELIVLMNARRSGSIRGLYFLPLLFLFWANVDVSFVYGVGTMILYVVAVAAEATVLTGPKSEAVEAGLNRRMRAASAAAAGCVIATLISPYSYQSYSAFFALQASPANRYLAGRIAMTFHQPQDYLVLLLTMAGFLSLGLRRSRDAFLLPLLAVCAALSFHAQGDAWLVVLVASAIIGDAMFLRKSEAPSSPGKNIWWSWPRLSAAISLVLVLLVWAVRVPRDRERLLSRVADTFPIAACDYIRGHQLPAPLFNSYMWGGFLTWYLPEYPVAIDGRRGLYPEDEEVDYFKVIRVLEPYQSLPAMTQARTLLLDKQSVIGDALREVPGFQVAYEDEISIVLLQKKRE